MTIGSISNTSVQPTLLALQNTANLLGQAEQALSTGNAVNSASDNAAAFYTSQSLLSSASSLSNVKDNLSTALTTVGSTVDSIGDVTQVVQQLQGITAQALATNDTTTRANLASQFNALLPQLDQLAGDANFNGTNLLNNASNSLVVPLNGTGTSTLTIQGVNATSSGLNITSAANGFATNADISAANSQLSQALSTLTTSAASFGGNATLIQTNQDFTSNLISNLQSASDNLVTADPDTEAANLLAAQAQSQLSVVSLAVSGQLEQSVLQLFKT